MGVTGNVNYHYSIDNPTNNEFVANFEKRKKKKPTNYHGEAYIAAKMLFQAIEKGDTTETKAIIKALEGLTFDSILGEVVVNEKDHQLHHPNYMGTVVEKDGNAVIEINYTSPIEDANK
ncbi:ABC transporter substrate-binding protein [Cytobacillus purgationiresistens]|uniref:ABC-type branched-subunit amino acid transport system substrate-binding protein n=1 Tax=Cytobacillus purgationiresistens TaxID=863449 RepID=A0ABU0AEE5_9BACI|nr:ABC transporter substrate-binding protein [Cytobacillus purgationiresistens]MDQ0269624.1 ABC-type branched-subunit amino acid transport system substrate-binding protein [Cytobacillus purgationiresistens]